jgi:biotin operon repressor
MEEAQMNALDTSELALIETSRWQREVMDLPLATGEALRLGATLALREQIWRILARGELVTAASIAHSVGLSERSVHRHIDRLRRAGMRIDGERGVGYLVRRMTKGT